MFVSDCWQGLKKTNLDQISWYKMCFIWFFNNTARYYHSVDLPPKHITMGESSQDGADVLKTKNYQNDQKLMKMKKINSKKIN